MPEVITYNATISACNNGMQWERALLLFNHMKQQRLVPSSVSYSAVIGSCGSGGQWERALGFFEESKAGRIDPSVISYSVVLVGGWGEWNISYTDV